jgi:hypothetical protein
VRAVALLSRIPEDRIVVLYYTAIECRWPKSITPDTISMAFRRFAGRASQLRATAVLGNGFSLGFRVQKSMLKMMPG